MGKIILTVEGTTVGTVATGGGVVYQYEVSEQDSARLIAAMATHHASAFQQSGPNGEPALEQTTANIIKVWFREVVRQALRLTEKIEARDITPPPVVVTES